MVRLFTLWQSPPEKDRLKEITYDRVSVPQLMIDDLFDDAFTAIARDGAAIVEVSIRLQKAFRALAETDDHAMVVAAKKHSRLALVGHDWLQDIGYDYAHHRQYGYACSLGDHLIFN